MYCILTSIIQVPITNAILVFSTLLCRLQLEAHSYLVELLHNVALPIVEILPHLNL